MAGRAAPTAIGPSGARRCHLGRQRQSRQRCAPVATDRLAPARCATRLAARRRRWPDAEISGGEVSSRSLPLARPLYSITSSARASSVGGTSRPRAFAVLRLITSLYL